MHLKYCVNFVNTASDTSMFLMEDVISCIFFTSHLK